MLIIKNGRMIDPASGTDGYRDILIDEGVILKIGLCGTIDDMAVECLSMKTTNMEADDEPEKIEEIDAGGMIVAPGLVDAHVHYRDPGFTEKEDIITGANAAKKGGFTSVVMMGNTNPHMDNEDTIKYALKKGLDTGIRVFTCANITKAMEGEELTDKEALLGAGRMVTSDEKDRFIGEGVVLFSDDGKPITDEAIMRKALEESAKYGKVLSLHEEDPTFITDNGVNHGEVSEKLGIVGSPRDAEIAMVKRDIALANETGGSITIQHLSTAEAVSMIREARKTNKNIHGEVTPHHFTLTDEAVLKHGTLAKMNPPLRTEADRQAIIEGLKDGTIETIATDHAPHTAEEKAKDIRKAPSGIIGLETSLGLGIRELVHKGHLDLMALLSKMTCEPAVIYGLGEARFVRSESGNIELMSFPVGRIYENGPADFVIFSENETWTVKDKFASKAVNSPFVGEELPGKIHYTICGGKIFNMEDM